jgi:hypothetical protein
MQQKEKYLAKRSKSQKLTKFFPMRNAKTRKNTPSPQTSLGHILLPAGVEKKLLGAVLKFNEQEISVNYGLIQRTAIFLYQQHKQAHPTVQFKDFQASPHWVFRFKKRHNLVVRKASKKKQVKNIPKLLKCMNRFFEKTCEGLPNNHPEMILNMDETPTCYVPSNNYTVCVKGKKTINIKSKHGPKKRVTSVLTISSAGTILDLYIIFPGLVKNSKSLQQIKHKKTTHLSSNNSGFMDTRIMLDYLRKVVIPYAIATRAANDLAFDEPLLLFMDAYKAHFTLPVVSLCRISHIDIILLPPNLTAVIQPLDVAFNRQFKRALDKSISEFYLQELDHADKLSDVSQLQAGRHDMVRWIETALHEMQKLSDISNAFDVTIFDRERTLARFNRVYPQ